MKTLLVTLHITGGSLAILVGMVALFLKKGSKLHNNLGRIFYYSMLVMAASAVYMSIENHEQTNIVVSLLVIYLVTTARKTLTNKKGVIGNFEKLALVYALIIVVVGIFLIVEIMDLRGNNLEPIDYFLFFYTFIALLGAILDTVVLINGKIVGSRRIVRHLWRMVFALWIAVGSLFLGQPQVFPQVLQDNPMTLASPFLLVTVTLLFWLVRVWFIKRFKHVKY
ncbi:hypothetical protein [Ekhidna sp.]|uniref:hypothetical protein n=1 Tax=Ekhidna sp. TaxID=2608089 RepID=UPI003296998F